jgi:hypothetical protein
MYIRDKVSDGEEALLCRVTGICLVLGTQTKFMKVDKMKNCLNIAH